MALKHGRRSGSALLEARIVMELGRCVVIPTAYALAIICGPKLVIAIARASQDQPPNKGPGSGPGQDRPSHLALPCLAYLASHRPRSPCLHLATTARPPAAAGRRGAPLLLLPVQARRARPMRGEVSQASQDLVSTPILTTTSYDELRQPTTNYDELAKSISRDVPEYPDILA